MDARGVASVEAGLGAGPLDRVPLGGRIVGGGHRGAEASIVRGAPEFHQGSGAMKKLTRLSSEDEQRRTINALVQRVQELEAVQAMLLSLLVELGAVDADEIETKVRSAVDPVRSIVPQSGVAKREFVRAEGDAGGPYRELVVERVSRVVVCDACGDGMASDRALYDDFGGCVCEDCFSASRLRG